MTHITQTNVVSEVRCDSVTISELRIRVSNPEDEDPYDVEDYLSDNDSEWYDDDTICGDEEDVDDNGRPLWMWRMDVVAQQFKWKIHFEKLTPSTHVFMDYMVNAGSGPLSDMEWDYLKTMDYKNYL